MHRFAAAFMWLIGSFFTWHNLNFFLFKNARGETGVFSSPAETPLSTVCERTAKVGVEGQILDFGFKILSGRLNFYLATICTLIYLLLPSNLPVEDSHSLRLVP